MDMVVADTKASVVGKGGPGSGNFGHAGIPGQQGGSMPSGVGAMGFGNEEENAHAARMLSRDMGSVLSGDLRGILSANGLQTRLVRGDIADHPDVPIDSREGIRGADAAFVPEGRSGPLLLLNDRNTDLKPIIAHEIGHIIDHSDPSRNFATTKINRQSMGKEFFEAYDGERNSLSRLARSDPREGFAEMFRSYWDDPGRFRRAAPKSAKYVDKVLAEGGLTIGQVFHGRRFEKARHEWGVCMECPEPATKFVVWAEGMAAAWFCDKHLAEWKEGDGLNDINETRVITPRALEMGPDKFFREIVARHSKSVKDNPPETPRGVASLSEGIAGRIVSEAKALPEERGTAPTRWFEDNFQDWFPESGKGKYVLQHHAFVPEELKDADYRRVVGTRGLGIHGDLRMDRGKEIGRASCRERV